MTDLTDAGLDALLRLATAVHEDRVFIPFPEFHIYEALPKLVEEVRRLRALQDRDAAMSEKFWTAARATAPFDGVAMEPDARYHLTQALGSLMSDWSEDAHAAGWLFGLEESLPSAIREEMAKPYSRPSIRSDIHPDERRRYESMAAIADALGHWANYAWYEEAGEHYVPYVPKCDRDAQGGRKDDEG